MYEEGNVMFVSKTGTALFKGQEPEKETCEIDMLILVTPRTPWLSPVLLCVHHANL